jgi:transposase-like protein
MKKYVKVLKTRVVKQYVEDKGKHCPYCGADMPILVETIGDYGAVQQTIACRKCMKGWVETYALTGVILDE